MPLHLERGVAHSVDKVFVSLIAALAFMLERAVTTTMDVRVDDGGPVTQNQTEHRSDYTHHKHDYVRYEETLETHALESVIFCVFEHRQSFMLQMLLLGLPIVQATCDDAREEERTHRVCHCHEVVQRPKVSQSEKLRRGGWNDGPVRSVAQSNQECSAVQAPPPSGGEYPLPQRHYHLRHRQRYRPRVCLLSGNDFGQKTAGDAAEEVPNANHGDEHVRTGATRLRYLTHIVYDSESCSPSANQRKKQKPEVRLPKGLQQRKVLSSVRTTSLSFEVHCVRLRRRYGEPPHAQPSHTPASLALLPSCQILRFTGFVREIRLRSILSLHVTPLLFIFLFLFIF
eukprot:TRINITY_DN370_c0_g1_i1.p2 TRINITY_DN370_c0_g1~~TRINITY_DN370_c0_g1_i1.p2  ORF type:complete len:342 (+),score=-9.80 TRINITY_DN370_c0_g1_i1:527-1552(+)